MSNSTPRPRLVSIPEKEEWRAADDCRALIEAEKIKADPKRHALAKAYAQKKTMELAAVATAA